MNFFERLKTAASTEWRAYTEHPFTNGLADGSLAEAAFRHYLVQDYLFLIEFARAYALSVYMALGRAVGPDPMLEAARAIEQGCKPDWPVPGFFGGTAEVTHSLIIA
jgi:thiaminase